MWLSLLLWRRLWRPRLLLARLLSLTLILRLLAWRLALWLPTRLPLVLLLILALLAWWHARRVIVSAEIALARCVVIKLLTVVVVRPAVAWRARCVIIALEAIIIAIVVIGLARPVSATGRVSLIAIILAIVDGTAGRAAIPIRIVSIPVRALRPAIPVTIKIAAAIIAVPVVVEIEGNGGNAERAIIFWTDIDAALLIDRLNISARDPATAAGEGNIAPRGFR